VDKKSISKGKDEERDKKCGKPKKFEA